MMNRRSLLAAACLASLASPVRAQAYPARPIRLVVPYAPGGGTDIAGRLLAQRLSGLLGQSMVVENRGGAGGNIGTQAIANAAKDGYSLLFAANSLTINAALYGNPGYDIGRDLTPVAGIAATPVLLVVRSEVAATDLGGFIALARAQPGALNHGTPGPGTPQHLAAELFNTMAGTSLVHIPYRGSGPAVAGLLSGEIQLMFASVSAVEPLIREGRVRALAITSAQRSTAWPQLPAIGEALPGYAADLWYALLGPKGLPPAVIGTLEAAAARALQDPEFIQLLRERGFEPAFSEAARLDRILTEDLQRWRELGQRTGIRIE